MAEVTATSVYRGSPGEYTLTIVNLPNTIDHNDTYVSGIQGIVSVMICGADAVGTQASTGYGAAVSAAATGTVILYLGENNSAATL